jgi:hypothetical protein
MYEFTKTASIKIVQEGLWLILGILREITVNTNQKAGDIYPLL